MSDNTMIPISRPASSITPPPAVQQALSGTTKVEKTESKFPTEVIDLPSKGWFYSQDNPLSSGQIELKMMTAKEEDILMSQNLIKKGKVLDKLMESLIVDKRIKIDDILICDKNAIFVAMRRLAYGDSYGPLGVDCLECGAKNKVTVDLSTFKEKEMDFSGFEKGNNRFEFSLPYSKNLITYKLLSQKDDDAISAEIESLKKINKDTGSDVTTRLKHVIVAVDGNDDKAFIRRFVDEGLTSRDSLALRRHMKVNLPDMDMEFDFKCESCGVERRMDTPIEVSFFWPDAGR
jgi:hypothetical protein